MSDIPSELYREILVRLPAESLLRLRAVCKEWRRLIDDPSFVKSHTNNQLSFNTLLIRNLRGDPLYLFSLDSLNFNPDDRQTIGAIPIKQLKRRGEPRLRELPVASCNGLMLIDGYESRKSWAIWNPLTRQCHDLPQFDCGFFMSKGLGYDYAADDYRVVGIDHALFNGLYEYRTHVYSMKSGSWRMVKNCPYPLLGRSSDGVYLNGSLHWKSRDFIIVFDIMTEDFRQLPLPKVRSGSAPKHLHLDALGGSLILSYYYDMNRFDGWVMNDINGVKDSWMKLFSLGQIDTIGYTARLRPVAYLKDKKQVLLQNDRAFLVVDIEENSVKKVKIHRQTRITSAQICQGSLVRLGDGGSGAAIATSGVKRKRQNINTRSGARLTFCVKDVDDGWHFSDSGCSPSGGGED